MPEEKTNKKGLFTISLDTELAWGAVDKPESYKRNKKYYFQTRDVIDRILNLFEKYHISGTWAIVGHLFLESCQQDEGVKHSNIIRSSTAWYKRDWFEQDPCSNIYESPEWYGKDIVDKIRDSSVYQEIGSHSFSHMIFNNPLLSQETVRSELSEMIQVAGNEGITIDSFVFPRNAEGYYEELVKIGIKVFRGIDQVWYNHMAGYKRKFFHIVDDCLCLSPPVYEAKFSHGMMNIPGSMLYLSRDGFRKLIPIKLRIIKAKKGIDRAIKEGKIFHLWFHPFNIASDSESLLFGLEEILKYVAEQVENKKLTVKTLSQIFDES